MGAFRDRSADSDDRERDEPHLDGDRLEALGRLSRKAYERVLRLTDLTASGPLRPAMRRELLRWRDLAAALYSRQAHDAAAHRAAFRALLRLTPASAKQLQLLAATRDDGAGPRAGPR